MARPASDLARRTQSGATPGGLRRAVPPLTVRSRLDLATVFGLFGGLCLVAVGIALGGEFKAFVDLPAILIVFGGTLAATTICFSIREVFGTQRVILKTFLRRVADPEMAALQLIQLAVRARTDGALSLENELGRLRGAPFLQQGIAMVVDSTPVDEIERALRRELHAIQTRHSRSTAVLRKAAEIAPAMGLIGTLIGLVQMLSHLDDPASIGPGMAVALITTFYGAILATLVLSPLAAKLERNSHDEIVLNQLFLIGCVSIARQENPRRLEVQLNALLPPAQRINAFE